MPRDVIPEEHKPGQIIPIPVPPRPTTRRAAQRLMTNELIWALRTRPETFHTRGRFVLEDKKSGMDWWIANGPLAFGLHGVADCSCNNIGIGFINKLRAWFAFKSWQRNQVERPDVPQIHEAERLAKINRM